MCLSNPYTVFREGTFALEDTPIILNMDLPHTSPFIALFALATHSVLHFGEWDNSLHIIVGVLLAVFSGFAATIYNPPTHNINTAFITTVTAAALYFAILTTSILLHRGFFHRLRNVRTPRPPS